MREELEREMRGWEKSRSGYYSRGQFMAMTITHPGQTLYHVWNTAIPFSPKKIGAFVSWAIVDEYANRRKS